MVERFGLSKAVELLADKYGHPLTNDYEKLCSFPAVRDLQSVSVENLRDCGLGYRASYVYDAIQKVMRQDIDLESIAEHTDDQLFRELQQINGVGKKVANCICLFGYGRKSCVPVDVWIHRAIQNELQGENLADLFGNRAGIMQQYVFFL